MIVVLAERRLSVDADRVRAIVEAGPVTLLPWSRLPVEGLAWVDGRPVVQVRGLDVGAIGDARQDGWLVVLRGKQPDDEIAVRVDGLVGFDPGGSEPAEPLATAHLWPDFAERDPGARCPDADQARSAPGGSILDVVVLETGIERLALCLEGLQGLGVIEAVETVTTLGGGRRRLARVDGRWLPAVILSDRFGAAPMIGTIAVVGGCPGCEVALLLPGRACFERIAFDALIRIPDLPGALMWWQSDVQEAPVGIYDFATLAGTAREPMTLGWPDVAPATPDADAAPPPSATVRLNCQGLVCALPLEVLGNALDPDDTPAPGALPRRRRPGTIPVLDGRRLLNGRTGGRRGLWVRLVPPAGPGLVLVVDSLDLPPPGADQTWLSPPILPTGTAVLIDAVAWDRDRHAWIYRLRPGLAFRILPMVAKRAVVAALIGWLPSPASPSPRSCRPEGP